VSFIAFLIVIVAEGLLVGALGRLALPGPDPMSIGETILVGIGGSVIAGVIARALFSSGAGIVLSVLCATGIVYLVRRSRSGPARR
jgi:uncharacterized membrane protein YeaQ/YmgE (transglycosylase-associated protein family)